MNTLTFFLIGLFLLHSISYIADSIDWMSLIKRTVRVIIIIFAAYCFAFSILTDIFQSSVIGGSQILYLLYITIAAYWLIFSCLNIWLRLKGAEKRKHNKIQLQKGITGLNLTSNIFQSFFNHPLVSFVSLLSAILGIISFILQIFQQK
jgi:hypothetical protein